MADLAADELWTLVVEAREAPDQLLRVVNPVIVMGARLVAATLERSPLGVTIRIEAQDLDPQGAETLRRRLQALPGVASVALAWRSPDAGLRGQHLKPGPK